MEEIIPPNIELHPAPDFRAVTLSELQDKGLIDRDMQSAAERAIKRFDSLLYRSKYSVTCANIQNFAK